MPKIAPSLPIALALALAGCNSAAPPPAADAAYVSPVTPPGFKLPEGAGCAGAVARYRAVMDNDKAHGHVGAGVYATILKEIDAAGAACGAGREGEANALVHASKVRHGYPG